MDDLIRALKALSDESRLKLLQLLPKPDDERCFCVGDLADQLAMSQSCVSHHLAILKSAGLVRCEKDCGCSYYVVNVEKLDSCLQQLRELAAPTSTPITSPNPLN